MIGLQSKIIRVELISSGSERINLNGYSWCSKPVERFLGKDFRGGLRFRLISNRKGSVSIKFRKNDSFSKYLIDVSNVLGEDQLSVYRELPGQKFRIAVPAHLYFYIKDVKLLTGKVRRFSYEIAKTPKRN